jgi:putative hydrolase of the HAD superfamily
MKAVLFDYGGVLTSSLRDATMKWIASENIDPKLARQVLGEWLKNSASPLAQFERGELAQNAFEEALASRLNVSAVGLLDRLFSNLTHDEAMWSFAADLRADGCKLAIVSNSWGDRYPRRRLEAAFDAVIISGEVGLRKPAREIYELAASRLGVQAADCVFIDDLELNVNGAIEAGMHGVLHVDATSTREKLDALR